MGNVAGHKRKENEMQIGTDRSLASIAEVRAWQALAVDEYERSLPGRHDALKAKLAARVLALTGSWIHLKDVYADEYIAVAGVVGATFSLHRGGDLFLVRACAYCGTGHFESPRISDQADLGYALSAWQPMHEDCEDFSSENLAEW